MPSGTFSILPVTVPLASVIGDDFSMDVSLKWESTNETAVTSPWTFEAKLKTSSTEYPYTVTKVAEGLLRITMANSITNTIPAGTHKWWLVATFPGGTKRTLMRGTHVMSVRS